MHRFKEIILVAIILMTMGIAFRSCQNSFAHSFVADELFEEYEWNRVVVDSGYFSIRVGMDQTLQRIWIIESTGIDGKSVAQVRRDLYDRGFPTVGMGQGFGFAIEIEELDYDSLVRAIVVVDKRLSSNGHN